MDYEIFVKTEMFGRSYKESCQYREYFLAFFHQLCLVYVYRNNAKIYNFFLSTAKKAFNLYRNSEAYIKAFSSFFQTCLAQNSVEFDASIINIFREIYDFIRVDNNLIDSNEKTKIPELFGVTQIILVQKPFEKIIYNYGPTIVVLAENLDFFVSVDSVHIRGPFSNTDYWPYKWSEGLMEDKKLKKIIKNATKFRNTNQEVFYQIVDIYWNCPWLEEELKKYLEIYSEDTGFQGYSKQPEIPAIEDVCYLCRAQRKKDFPCFLCQINDKNWTELRKQMCDYCKNFISEENFCVEEGKIYHLDCN
jgi:hypothetical protein